MMKEQRNITFKIVVLALSNLVVVLSVRDDLIVKLPDGKIKGHTIISPFDRIVFRAWQGIPFAAPPLGKLRFQGPLPPQPWLGIKNTTADKNCCIPATQQYESTFGPGPSNQDEDCLYLSVYTPLEKNNRELLPVMVWIYGGGFITGCSSYEYYGPDYLVNKDVIVVAFNYRLGSYGFLSTGDDIVLGNAGLKDQLLALQWTQKNIHLFGGDRKKVTIFGESAGGFSVGIHIWNKKSAGLFRAAICESGCSFSLLTNRNPKENAYALAKIADPNIHENITTSQIKNLLQSLPEKNFTEIQSLLVLNDGVVVEAKNKDAFVTTNHTFSLIESGNFNRVPLIIGTTSNEAIALQDLQFIKKLAYVADTNSKLLVASSNVNPKPGSNITKIAGIIRETYAGKNTNFSLNLAGFLQYLSDDIFTRPSLKQAQLQSKYTPVYLYKFSYYGSVSKNKNYPNITGAQKVGHSDEIPYLFKVANVTITNSDRPTRSRLVKLWTNFAKTLNPTPDPDDPVLHVLWRKVKPDNLRYLNINNSLEVQPLTNVEAERFKMWNYVFYKYGTKPFVRF